MNMNIKKIITYSLSVLLIACLSSCANELVEVCHNSDIDNSDVHVQIMKVSFNKPTFDNSNDTRAAISEDWRDGDVLYLRFKTESSYIQGKAIYNTANNYWTVTYKGELPTDKESSLQVWYFDGETFEEGDYVNLQPETSLYCDEEGLYLYNSAKELTCVAHLKPASSRLRFVGNSGTKISITGLCMFKYNYKNGTLGSLPISSIELTVLPTGTTTYIYVAQNEKDEELCVSDSHNDFCMVMNEDFLNGFGGSGYLNIPTISNHEGWEVYDHHDYVDLGLPSGTLWATCNVGATAPEEFGNYYAWAEIETKNKYWSDNYKWGEPKKYTKYVCHGETGLNYFTDNKTKMDAEDDVANIVWKRDWHLPDNEQFKEMVDNCSWSLKIINDIYAFVGESKLNGKEIILPAADSFTYKQFVFPGEYSNNACYWTSDLYNTQNANSGIAYHFLFTSLDNQYITGMVLQERYYGHTVRPVK